MEELYEKLNNLPRAYFGFVMGVITYCKKSPERLQKVLEFLNSNDNLTTSDVVRFISNQSDFFEDNLGKHEMVG